MRWNVGYGRSSRFRQTHHAHEETDTSTGQGCVHNVQARAMPTSRQREGTGATKLHLALWAPL